MGIGKIIPGVSGAMIALSMGLYEKGILALNNFWKKESFLFLLKTGFGILLALILGSKVLIVFLEKYYFYTLCLFTGLIFCSVLQIKNKIRLKSPKIIIPLVVSIGLSALLMLKNPNLYQFTFQKKDYLFLFFVGIVEAFSMIVPGVSGTALMMMMGVYNFLITSLSNLANIQHFIYHLYIFIPFLFGFIFGVLFFIKLIHFLFSKYEEITYYFIFGFILSAFFFLVKNLMTCIPSFFSLFLGILLFLIGLFVAYQFDC